jgi:hypothetical protein
MLPRVRMPLPIEELLPPLCDATIPSEMLPLLSFATVTSLQVSAVYNSIYRAKYTTPFCTDGRESLVTGLFCLYYHPAKFYFNPPCDLLWHIVGSARLACNYTGSEKAGHW